jgi:hypothetical protein
MTTSHFNGSAKIYQFPVGGRAAVNSRRDEIKPATDIAPSLVAFGSGGWYHEEAIQEAEKARKN